MPNTKLTRAKWNNHLHYSKYIYVVIALVAWFGADIVYTMTEYRPPKDRKVEIQLVSEYSDTSGLESVAENALAAGQAFDETLEAVEFYSLMYSGQEDDVYGSQKFMVMLAAQEGHIYIMNRGLMESIVLQGAAFPLDEYIESGVLKPGDDVDLQSVTYNAISESGEAVADETHVYALPVAALTEMLEPGISYDVRDKYAVIMSYVPNPDTVAVVLQSIMEQLTP